MQFLKPSFQILKKYQNNPHQNLKLVLSRELNKLDKFYNHQAITRTVYEVIRHFRLLEYIIQIFSQRKQKKIQHDLQLYLKIGAYLLIFSHSYPDYAIVNEVVKNVKPNAKGFANAILRKIASSRSVIDKEINEIKTLGIKYSISNDLIDSLKLISPHLEKDLEYLNQQPQFHLRINRNMINYEKARSLLQDFQISFRELEVFQSFETNESSRMINQIIEEWPFYFQNTASQMISIIASKFANNNVLDCCAAPGTKSITLASLNPGLHIVANDINPRRLFLMKNFLNKYHFPSIKLLASDISKFYSKKNFDLIILDAPCTSAGTIRKNPDLKLKITKTTIKQNAEKQEEILDALITNISAPATILYSVCSFTKEETEDCLEKFFKKHQLNFQLSFIDISSLLKEYGFYYKKCQYGSYLLTNPNLNNDLFYIALFRIEPFS